MGGFKRSRESGRGGARSGASADGRGRPTEGRLSEKRGPAYRRARASRSVGADAYRLPESLHATVARVLEAVPVDAAGRRSSALVAAWPSIVGVEGAANSTPYSLRNGRLTVATSSSAWAQALQDQSSEVISRVQQALGDGAVHSVLFRPAGWDPCDPRDGPRPLVDRPLDEETEGGPPNSGAKQAVAARKLMKEEESAIDDVRRAAVDEDLGAIIARAMRASLAYGRPTPEPEE